MDRISNAAVTRDGKEKYKMIDKIYGLLDSEGCFDLAVSDSECRMRLNPFRAKLSEQDFEQVRDAVFSVSAVARKQSFRIGFQTALLLVMECMER